MSKPCVSVLVSIYNVEEYLDECLASLVNQTLKNIEIILVNDGSTDMSQEIAEKYADSDERVRLVNKKNGGAGSARNVLMGLASGEYSMYMDADDYINLDTLEVLYKTARDTPCEIVIYNGQAFQDFGAKLVFSDKKYFNLSKKDENAVLSGLEFVKKTGGTIQHPCMKLFSTQFLQGNQFRHLEGVAGSDAVFFYQSMIVAKKVTYVDFVGYFRRYRPNSIVTNPCIKGTRDRMQNFETLFSYLPLIGQEEYVNVVKDQYALYACALWVLAAGRKKREDREALLSSFRECGLDSFIRENRKGAIQIVISLLISLPRFFDPIKLIVCILIRKIFKSKSRLFV